MSQEEIYYTIALTRMTGFNFQTALQLYQELGGGRVVYEHRNDIRDVLPECSSRLAEALKDWNLPLARAAQEMAFIEKHHIQVLCYGDEHYPARLAECPDAPIVLYYLGSADLNQQRIINIVGTRRCTPYGQDLVRRFMSELRSLCPQVLVVSGLAYGIDICAHREALAQGYDTVGVLAHGLDDLYPPSHRLTADQMLKQGGLLTEFPTCTRPDRLNFVRRNRIVAGLSDATLLVESAIHGGGLITTRIADDYGRDVFAFPGAVGAPYSEGCNDLIRRQGAGLIMSAKHFVEAMGWQNDAQLSEAQAQGIERQLFPELTADEQRVVAVLQRKNDLQINILSVQSGIAVGPLTALLFSLEMKGVVRTMAGGTYHLLM